MVATMNEPTIETGHAGPTAVVITRVSLSFGNLMSLVFRGLMALFVVGTIPFIVLYLLIIAIANT